MQLVIQSSDMDSLMESDECKYLSDSIAGTAYWRVMNANILSTQFQRKGSAWVQGFTDYVAPWPSSNSRQAQIGQRQWILALMMDE